MKTEINYIFTTIWSEEDKEFVGLCKQFPSLSYLDADEAKALEGIKQLVLDVIKDELENESPDVAIGKDPSTAGVTIEHNTLIKGASS